MTFTLDIKTASQIEAEELQTKRGGMRAYKRALRKAMLLFPSNTHAHMLEEVDTAVASLGTYDPAKTAWTDVTEFVRTNPDVASLAEPFGFDDNTLDNLFIVAMALEGGATDQEALAEIGL